MYSTFYNSEVSNCTRTGEVKFSVYRRLAKFVERLTFLLCIPLQFLFLTLAHLKLNPEENYKN